METTYAFKRTDYDEAPQIQYVDGQDDYLPFEWHEKRFVCWQPDEFDDKQFNLVCIDPNGDIFRAMSIDFDFVGEIPSEGVRKEQMKHVYSFLVNCSPVELYSIVEEIRCVHDNLFAFNPTTKLFAKIASTCLNGESIQLNIEE